MMLMRVSGKDGYGHYHHGPCRGSCCHQALDKDTLKRVLAKVDARRCESAVQERYSEKDSVPWFGQVTEELYNEALTEAGVSADSLAAARECVYTARSRCKMDYDEEMQQFMSDLVHVKYDLTDDWELSCPPELPEVSLHTLEGTTVSLNDYVNRSSPTVVLAGSWS